MTTVLDTSDDMDQSVPPPAELNGHSTASKPKRARKVRVIAASIGETLTSEQTTQQILEGIATGRAQLIRRRDQKAKELMEIDMALQAIGLRGVTSGSTTLAAVVTAPTKRGVKTGRKADTAPKAPKPTGKRLRRSTGDIAASVETVLAAVKAAGDAGLRSEQIRAATKIDKKHLPKVLKTALADNLLTVTGQKRSSTYFAV